MSDKTRRLGNIENDETLVEWGPPKRKPVPPAPEVTKEAGVIPPRSEDPTDIEGSSSESPIPGSVTDVLLRSTEAIAGRDQLPSIEVPPHAERMLGDRKTAAPDEDTAPRIGEYALIARFPSSDTAEVFLGYKVTNFGFIRRAVVKWTDKTREDYAVIRQNLLDEARAISFVDHPNIVTILDLADDAAGTYVALEYVAGTDLRRLLSELADRKDRIPMELSCFVVCELLRGLAHVHEARGPDGQHLGIVHRDVNPSNVLISEDGHIKLTDFGTVLMYGRMQDKTAPGLVKGKVRYLAPEYIADQACTHQVDLYSVGVMFFEMLTGRPCFSAQNNTATMLKIVREGVPIEELAELHLPPELVEIVTRSTNRDPAERFASAMDMCNQLEDWMTSGGIFVSPSKFSTYLHAHGLLFV